MFNDSSAEKNLLLSLMTPLEQWVWVRPGAIDAEVVETLSRKEFDNAPLSGADGVIATSYLEQVSVSDRPLLAEIVGPPARRSFTHRSERH